MFSIPCIVLILFVLLYVHYYQTTIAENYQSKTLLDLLDSISESNIGEVKNCDQIPSLDCIYCIYMEDRRNYMESRFKKYDLDNITYVKACTPLDLTLYDYETYSDTMKRSSPIYKLLTKFPVHLSYLACMYHAWKQNFKYILVFEDDLLFTEPVSELIRISQAFTTKDTGDVCYLGYCHLDCNVKVQQIDNDLLSLPYDVPIRCKHAMIHKMDYVGDFLKNHGKLKQRSDVHFEKYYRQNKIRRVICRKPFIFQNRLELKSHNQNNSTHLTICDF